MFARELHRLEFRFHSAGTESAPPAGGFEGEERGGQSEANSDRWRSPPQRHRGSSDHAGSDRAEEPAFVFDIAREAIRFLHFHKFGFWLSPAAKRRRGRLRMRLKLPAVVGTADVVCDRSETRRCGSGALYVIRPRFAPRHVGCRHHPFGHDSRDDDAETKNGEDVFKHFRPSSMA